MSIKSEFNSGCAVKVSQPFIQVISGRLKSPASKMFGNVSFVEYSQFKDLFNSVNRVNVRTGGL